MTAARQHSSAGAERFSLPSARERWLEFLPLEHSTLPLPIGFEREGDDLLVQRGHVPGRAISQGRIASQHCAGLFLQACGLFAFLQAFGFWLAEEDLTGARHDSSPAGPRLWLTRTPLCVAMGGPGPAPSSVLAAFLHRLFAHGRRISHPAARVLFERMLASDAQFRRAEFWLAAAYRSFAELSSPEAAQARLRTIGFAGFFLRDLSARTLLAQGRALCEGRQVRVFSAGGSSLTPGAALGAAGVRGGVAEAARALAEREARASALRRPLWIAVEPARWDSFSRQAFDSAAQSLGDEVEVLPLEDRAAVPRLADEWRREIFVPCGTLSASLRFYEGFAEETRAEPTAAREIAERLTASPDWAAFAADPTGDAPLPIPRGSSPSTAVAQGGGGGREVLEALAAAGGPVSSSSLARFFPGRPVASLLERLRSRGDVAGDPREMWRVTPATRARVVLKSERRRALCRRWAQAEQEPGRRIEFLLDGGEVEQALSLAQIWRRESGAPVERWFALSARLSAAAGTSGPAWLDLLEAEREIAGGLLEEAAARLTRVARGASSSREDQSAARLRCAEILSLRGRLRSAGAEAAAWRQEFPVASASDRARSFRMEARARAREGDHEAAFELLAQAQREQAGDPLEERLETTLARAGVYSLAGRFREEKETYEGCRPEVLAGGDDRLVAHLLAHEALGLADRREFAPAIARLEEALGVLRDDPVERARISIDLAGTLYHAGRTDRCAEMLEEAIGLASRAGREDLVRAARRNRVELAIHRFEWDDASREAGMLLADAENEKDDVGRLVALHQRSRVALRRGLLEEAQRDNSDARALAKLLSDRLEVGELWLEDGDRALYAGDIEAARAAWESAAEDPPDRCDTDSAARERLQELAWRRAGGPPAQAVAALASELAGGDSAAAERAARWRILFESAEIPPDLFEQASQILTRRGSGLLARRLFGEATGPVKASRSGELRALRDAVAQALAGEECSTASLGALGLSGVVIRDAEGREVVRLAARGSGPAAEATCPLHAGAAVYELALWPAPTRDRAEEIALLFETLLYRTAATSPPADFAEGWKRLSVITGDSSLEEPYRRLVRFAPQAVTVLVLGESGSGKEGVARAIHRLSPRHAGPFVAVNVPALPAALLESELFGHAKGAFTGADHDRRGLLEEAHGGTIFLDEIGDMSLSLQSKLLRALQEREVRRVGENRSRTIDVRVVSATSRPLAAEVERGAFREDLYYRLHVAVISLPPLRERGRDSVLLARHFLEVFAAEYGRGQLRFAPEALTAIAAHSWPGNVRELQNAIAQAAALADAGGVVTADLLPRTLVSEHRPVADSQGYRSRVNAHRRDLIAEALDKSGGNRTRAARDLGLSRQALLYLIRELNVTARPRSGH